MTVTIQRIPKKEHPGPELIRNHQTYRKGLQRAPLVGASGLGIVLSHETNLALISHHTMTREPRQSPQSNSSGKNDVTVTIQEIPKKEHPGPELMRNHQTYRKSLQRAPLVGATGLIIVLTHQTNLALISHHTMTREPRQSPQSNSSGTRRCQTWVPGGSLNGTS
jgi:hypothetical protein